MTWSLSQQTTTRAGTVRYDRSGSGPDLVLVHGTPWSSFCWHQVIPTLSERFRVHWYDLPGYGRSQMAKDRRISLDVQGEVLGEMLDHWGLTCPLVVGHDFGGAITLRAHLLAGRDYERLVLLDAVALAPWGSPFFAHVRKHVEAFLGLPAHIHKAVVEAYIRGALAAPLPAGDFDGLVSPWLTEEGQPAFYRQIAQADQRYTDEVQPSYGKIRCPVLVGWGMDDPWIPIETGRRLHAAIPGAQFHVFNGAGHLVQLEAAPLVASTLMNFLSAENDNAPDFMARANNG